MVARPTIEGRPDGYTIADKITPVGENTPSASHHSISKPLGTGLVVFHFSSMVTIEFVIFLGV